MNETQNQDNQKTQDNFKKTVSLTEIDDKVGFCVTNNLFGTTSEFTGFTVFSSPFIFRV